MNLILLFAEDFVAEHQVRLRGRRRDHMLGVHRIEVGAYVTVGLVDGKIGRAQITAADAGAVDMTVELTDSAPAPLAITLVLALPRPKMLKRVLQTVATMGVKKLILINSYRVEKSYWQTPILQEQSLREHLTLGLEQGKDTVMPEVLLRKRFKPFVQDELPAIAAGSRALVAHPGDYPPCPSANADNITLAIGPEGGFIPYEVEMLEAGGFAPVSLGPRILRVETAIPVLLSKLF